MWNDQLASPEAHAVALTNIVLANLEAIARIRSDRGGWWIGSEGFDVPVPFTDSASAEADRRRALGWLVWDLHLGRDPLPGLDGLLDVVDSGVLDRIDALTVSDRLVAGLDIYPTSVTALGGDRPDWSADDLVALAITEIERWHDRYEQPFWIAETSNLTLPLDQQIPWLDAFAAGLHGLRAVGRPARGLCWYSRGDQFDWQTALTNPTGAVTEVGLFDTGRRARPVAARFAQLATQVP